MTTARNPLGHGNPLSGAVTSCTGTETAAPIHRSTYRRTLSPELARSLRAWRLRAGLSQRQLARAAGAGGQS